jgi:hypothetical protein
MRMDPDARRGRTAGVIGEGESIMPSAGPEDAKAPAATATDSAFVLRVLWMRIALSAFLDQPGNKRFNWVTMRHKRYASVLTRL